MMRLTDTAQLTYTKLRARKVRLIVTVVISSLLFGVLALSSFVVRGIVASTSSFAEEGFGKRYILSAGPTYSSDGIDIYTDKPLIDKAIALQKDQIARKKVEAKRLGIDYDATTERLVYNDSDGPNGKQRYLDGSHPLAVQVIKDYQTTHSAPGLPELKKLSAPYQAIRFYESRNLSFGGEGVGELKVLKSGKESFDDKKTEQGNPFTQGLDSFTSNWSLMSGGLLKTFTLDGTDGLATSKDGVLPIVAPYTAVEQLLQLQPLPASASADAKLARLKEVRAKASSVEFGVCYRNPTSIELINQAVSTKRELEQNKSNKNYTKPKLIYDLPTEPCAPAKIIRDIRDYDEKKLAAKQLEFRQLFGEQPPEQSIIKFKVIGVSPDPPGFNMAFIDGLVGSVLSSTIGANWFTPLELRANNPILAKFFPDQQTIGFPASYYVELPSVDIAKKMLNEANCNPDFGGRGMVQGGGPSVVDFSGEFMACAKVGKVFLLAPYGGSSLALDDLQKGFSKVFRIAAMVITLIAGLIMMGTIGRVIADSRRETAVFRAIGAKRLDIAQVYISYALVLSVMIFVCALATGFVLAGVAQTKWASQFTIKALVAYNAQDLTRQFHFYAWYGRDLLYILLASLSAGLVSTVFPLIRNLRRNPIKDMRDEN